MAYSRVVALLKDTLVAKRNPAAADLVLHTLSRRLAELPAGYGVSTCWHLRGLECCSEDVIAAWARGHGSCQQYLPGSCCFALCRRSTRPADQLGLFATAGSFCAAIPALALAVLPSCWPAWMQAQVAYQILGKPLCQLMLDASAAMLLPPSKARLLNKRALLDRLRTLRDALVSTCGTCVWLLEVESDPAAAKLKGPLPSLFGGAELMPPPACLECSALTRPMAGGAIRATC